MSGRILIVDDEKALLIALRGLLSKEGYQVETASSGEEALGRIETGSFHLVVTDLSMNGVSGMDVLERARVRVVDNGAGIPPEKIDRIFNPFFTTKDNGTGLGMAISKKIVEAHDGSIDVLSEPGRGAEFVVNLPLPH